MASTPYEKERDPRRWLILAVLCLSMLVVVIDNMVLNVAIPSLIRDLGASTADIQWILDAYILVFAGLLLTAGGLSDRHGRRRGLVIGMAIFGVASAIATFCQTPGQLIAVRAVMGAGAAFLFPGTLSILTTVFDDAERKKAIAVWSSVLMLGALGAPLVGGVLLNHFWWGSIFWMNIPVAALGIIAALAFIPESRGPAGKPDLLGALLSMIGMGALVWGVINTSRAGWGSAQTVGGFVVAVLGLVAFVLWERRVAEPMLPMKLFRDRNFSGASFSVVLLSFSAGGIVLAITQYLQFVLGYSPLKAGLAFIPMLVTAMAFNGIGVLLDKRVGGRAAIATGMLLLAAGFGVLASLRPEDGYAKLVIAMVVMGMGSGTTGPAAYGTLLGSLPKDRAGVGSAVNDTVQQVGSAFSVAVLGSVLTAAYQSKMPHDLPEAARHSIGEALGLAATTGDPGLAQVAKSAFVHATSVASLVGVFGGIAAAIVAVSVLRKGKKEAEAPATPEPVAAP